MNRRAFLKTTLLSAPAILTLSSLPARAGATGSTLIETAGLSASGSADIPGFGPGGNGRVSMTFTSGPAIVAQFGPAAITRLVNAASGDRFGVLFNGINGAASHQTAWTLDANAAAGARARFRVDGGLEAEASAVIGGDQYQGAGVAAMILAALSAGATLRNAPTNRVQALVRPHAAPSGMAFGLEVTVQAT
ncbi:hypothetical protein [Gymnodinialimonas ceratoperidinii]|uniref:Secreted protein n=1 Tax=Gymnodinialimonas ceratoperidinii TaxID=2856823 RepID=A0A8F6TVI5_9RHOB|nr:hypothetical protein [Gymnodinialimonas ceratoperidinii]QXT38673.1 hypothetical protein KYE46_12090 [Gymnodinialimonas ceratoperidinii]